MPSILSTLSSILDRDPKLMTPSRVQHVRNTLIGLGFAPFLATMVVNLLLNPPRYPISTPYIKNCLKTNKTPQLPKINWFKAVSNTAGYVGLEIMAGQLLMGCRFPLIEKYFGFDKSMLQHRKLAYTSIAMTALHLAEKVYSKVVKTQKNNTSLAKSIFKFLFSFSDYKPYIYGRFGFWGMCFVTLLAYLQIQPDRTGFIPYYWWKGAHYTLYLWLAAAFWHSWTVGSLTYPRYPRSPKSKSPVAKAKFSIMTHLYHRKFFGVLLKRIAWFILSIASIYVTAWRFNNRISRKRNVWIISSVKQASLDVTTITMKPKFENNFANRRCGQFCILRKQLPIPNIKKTSFWDTNWGWWPSFARPKFLSWSEPHPFTFSGDAESEELEITIKSFPSGYFTPTVSHWKTGDLILLEGPFGIFTPDFRFETNIVMLAGGVGVTPFLSIIRQLYTQREEYPNTQCTLVWGIKDSKDIIFIDVLNQIVSACNIRIILVLSTPNAKDQLLANSELMSRLPVAPQDIHQGFISKTVLESIHSVSPPTVSVSESGTKNQSKPSFYLCGPPAMNKAVIPLMKLIFDISEQDIHKELFSW